MHCRFKENLAVHIKNLPEIMCPCLCLTFPSALELVGTYFPPLNSAHVLLFPSASPTFPVLKTLFLQGLHLVRKYHLKELRKASFTLMNEIIDRKGLFATMFICHATNNFEQEAIHSLTIPLRIGSSLLGGFPALLQPRYNLRYSCRVGEAQESRPS